MWLKDIRAEGNWMDLKPKACLLEMLRKEYIYFFSKTKQTVSGSDPQLLQSVRPPVTSAKGWTQCAFKCDVCFPVVINLLKDEIFKGSQRNTGAQILLKCSQAHMNFSRVSNSHSALGTILAFRLVM